MKSGGSCRMFPETGHQVCGRILEYWGENGGLPVFGYPITDQAAQQVEGKTFQTQLFERNRLELHPAISRGPAPGRKPPSVGYARSRGARPRALTNRST